MSVIDLDSFHNGPRIFEISKFSDLRGSFEILFQLNQITENEPKFPHIIQWNCIRAKQSSVRGFHGAKESVQHWKVLSCVNGKIRDAYLDIRPRSRTFGCVAHIDLEHENPRLIVIPPGFAHAFECLASESLVLYGTNIKYEDQTEIDKRMARVMEELDRAPEFDRMVYNEDLETAIQETTQLIRDFLNLPE
jgi:dTDP-4-dehydrorhamnose 3,5-epimerase-like enzyme